MKARFKRILIFLAIPVLLGVIIHYTVTHQVKHILQLLVERESDNAYRLNASKIEVSFWNKSFIVEHAQIISVDSTKEKTHYTIELPRMFLSIDSWGNLLMQNKVCIDSVHFIDSRIKIYERSPATNKKNIQVGDVFSTIEKVLNFLEVRSFSVQNGAFEYKSIHSEKVLTSTGINFSIKNLSGKNKKGHLFYSEDIRVNIENQLWEMPDGIHSIRFKSLNFSGKNQYFELDSCIIHAAGTEERTETTLLTEKFFFNDLEFSSLYENNTLSIDTLLCIKPVFIVGADTITKESIEKDTAKKDLSKLLPGLFQSVHFNYINIEDGQLILKNNKPQHDPNTFSQKSDLKVYNLSLQQNRSPYFKTDSILFGLKNIEFNTPDSTFKIIASELMIVNNDLVLKNSSFGPVAPVTQGKSISFSAPEFRLVNIDFISLIQKRLKADKAELLSPCILIRTTKNSVKRADTAIAGIDRFYSSLHEFRELVGIETLQIYDGTVKIQNPDRHNTRVYMQGINALVLPIHFVNSDSLIEIKHSMPAIEIAQLTVESDNLHLQVENFYFDGINRKNYADHVRMSTQSNNLQLEAWKLYWGIFDWDLFQKYKRIQISDFRASKLNVQLNHKPRNKNENDAAKDLPDLRVGKLNVTDLKLHTVIGQDTFALNGRNISFDSIRSKDQFLIWENGNGFFENVLFSTQHSRAAINYLQMATRGETVIKNLRWYKKTNGNELNIHVPLTRISGKIYSTDFSALAIKKIELENPLFSYRKTTTGPGKHIATLQIPMDIHAEIVRISNASVQYQEETAGSIMSAFARIDLKLTGLTASENNIQYEELNLTLKDLLATGNLLPCSLASMHLDSKYGSLTADTKKNITFHSDLTVRWKDAAFDKPFMKSNSVLQVKNISGDFSNPDFSYTTNNPLKWQSLLYHTNIQEGAVTFANPEFTFSINKLNWQTNSKKLALHNINYMPTASREEAMQQASEQFDYLTLTGASMELRGLRLHNSDNDSLIHVRKIILDQFTLSSTRDKNLPRKKGKLKAMPTKVIQSIPWPVLIDSIQITDSKVLVQQIEPKSTEEVVIPIEHINALITTVSNTSQDHDSLRLVANARIADVTVKKFSYTESYSDSLSYFHVSSFIIPGKFKSLNPITVPLAHILIDDGYSNKLTAAWEGNKYAAIGQMNFIYSDLAIQLLHKGDSSQTNLGLMLENTIANNVIRKNNTKSSVIFFERNSEKQIFNYWLKATLQGVFSATGLKSNSKSIRHYKKAKTKYHLPQNTVAEKVKTEEDPL
ncbi:MAG: hypothetical protein ACTHJT_07175 [Cytophaga sp.]|uniref:hypothetical protein n=1 Tax=Cytophaga sp. TaxID=29535 RepID=UPI003F7EC4F4